MNKDPIGLPGLTIDTDLNNENNEINIDAHIQFLKIKFNSLTIPMGDIFEQLYNNYNNKQNIRVKYNNKQNKFYLKKNLKHVQKPPPNIKFSRTRKYKGKTAEILRIDEIPSFNFLFRSKYTYQQEYTFVKKYKLYNDGNNNKYGIIYVLHEICMQLYGYLLIRRYKKSNTFIVVIPLILNINFYSHKGSHEESPVIEVEMEYIPENTKNMISISGILNLFLQPPPTDNSQLPPLPPPTDNSQLPPLPPPKDNSQLPPTDELIKILNNVIKTYSKHNAKKKRATKSSSKSLLSTNHTIKYDNKNVKYNLNADQTEIVIKLHNTIVNIFEYFKKNNLLHLDTAIRNVYFDEKGQLVIIDFGESLISDDKCSISEHDIISNYSPDIEDEENSNKIIVYVNPECQYDGYPITNSRIQRTKTTKDTVFKWLTKYKDTLPRYGGKRHMKSHKYTKKRK